MLSYWLDVRLKGVEFSTRCLPNCYARRGAGNKKYVWELEGRGVPRTNDTQDFVNCAENQHHAAAISDLCLATQLDLRLGSENPCKGVEFLDDFEQFAGTLPKCRKSGSLEVGECIAQKIKIGQPSAENPGKGVEFSYARRGA